MSAGSGPWATPGGSDLAEFWPAELAAHGGLRDRLLTAYGDARRGYHDVRHLREVLERVRMLTGEAAEGDDAWGRGDLTAVLLAAWFHDAVYDGEAGAEERSAVLAEKELDAAGLDPALVHEVARLVRLTATHRVQEGDRNGAALCDADLAILAADENRYREYVEGVRAEYAHVSDRDFERGRAAVLRALAEQESLFRTEHGRRHWEPAARANLTRELRELEAGT